jgi:hypothetical protein
MRRRAAGIRYVWLVCGTAVLVLDTLSSGARPGIPRLGASATALVALATITTGVGVGLVGGVLGKVVHSRLADPSDR